jgi:hypothetical protein
MLGRKYFEKIKKNYYLTGVVAPEPPLDDDEHGCVVVWVGDVVSPDEAVGVACDTNHESTTFLVPFLEKNNRNLKLVRIDNDFRTELQSQKFIGYQK